jgi:phage terminase small subunit
MPRKSAAAMAIFPAVDGRRDPLKPRPDIPPKVREIFLSLVKSVPTEHFRDGDSDLVEQYSQSIELARTAYAALDQDGPVVAGKPSPWLAALEKAHKSSAALAARLRLCPQSRTDPKSAGAEKRVRYPAPWLPSRRKSKND